MADLFGGISDTIMDTIQAILYATIYKLLYYLAVGFCWIVNLLYSMFEVMAGLSKVSYDGDYDYLINVFFSNTTVSKIYWGMALIGLSAGFAFAIAAVIKKMFDLSDKEKRSYGQILRGLFKSMLTIVCMSLIITMVLNATTLLMQQINYVFINADDLDNEQSITYTNEEYAAMARVLNEIGNFSLNPSYNNRYNLNKCFNEIRLDLQYLKTQGVFDFHYVTTDVQGNTIATWQSALQKIANSASLDRDLSMDVYHESVSNSILQAMELLKVNGSFKPLEEYQRQYQASRTSVPLDRLLFLMASMRAAKNEDYNVNPSLTDPLRGAYYYGEKSIYDLDVVNEDFDIGIAALDYVILFLTCYKMLETLATIILNCVGRIFNMLLLYLISPVIVSVSSLDDGAKFKQWTTAFIVQSFSVFGTVISMRVFLLFMPIVVDPKLVLFDNVIGNLLAKLVIILGAFEVSEKATNLITGILADNAGWQSITAGDMSSTAKGAVAKGKAIAKGALIGGVGGAAAGAVGIGVKGGLKVAAGAGLAAGYGVYGAAKGVATGGKALVNKISAWRNSGKKEAAGGGGDSGSKDKGSSGGGGEGKTDSLPKSERNPDDSESKIDNSNISEGGNSIQENQRNLGNDGTGNTPQANPLQTNQNTNPVTGPKRTDSNNQTNPAQSNQNNAPVPGTNRTGSNIQPNPAQPNQNNAPVPGANRTGSNSQANSVSMNQRTVLNTGSNPTVNSSQPGAIPTNLNPVSRPINNPQPGTAPINQNPVSQIGTNVTINKLQDSMVMTGQQDRPYQPAESIFARAEAIQNAREAAVAPNYDVTQKLQPKKSPPKTLETRNRNRNS